MAWDGIYEIQFARTELNVLWTIFFVKICPRISLLLWPSVVNKTSFASAQLASYKRLNKDSNWEFRFEWHIVRFFVCQAEWRMLNSPTGTLGLTSALPGWYNSWNPNVLKMQPNLCKFSDFLRKYFKTAQNVRPVYLCQILFWR